MKNEWIILLLLVVYLLATRSGADGQSINLIDPSEVCTNCPDPIVNLVGFPSTNPYWFGVGWTTMPAQFSVTEWSELQTTTNNPWNSNPTNWTAVCSFAIPDCFHPPTNTVWIPCTAPEQFFRVATKFTQ